MRTFRASDAQVPCSILISTDRIDPVLEEMLNGYCYVLMGSKNIHSFTWYHITLMYMCINYSRVLIVYLTRATPIHTNPTLYCLGFNRRRFYEDMTNPDRQCQKFFIHSFSVVNLAFIQYVVQFKYLSLY